MPILNVPGEIHIPNEILDEEQIEAALALYNEHNSWNSESHQSIYKSIFANLIQYVMHIIFKNRTLVPDQKFQNILPISHSEFSGCHRFGNVTKLLIRYLTPDFLVLPLLQRSDHNW